MDLAYKVFETENASIKVEIEKISFEKEDLQMRYLEYGSQLIALRERTQQQDLQIEEYTAINREKENLLKASET